MFQIVLNSIQKTVDIISPKMSDEIEFKFHCDRLKELLLLDLTNEQILNDLNTTIIEDTKIPYHLNEIMRLLLEDNQRLFLTATTTDNLNELTNDLIKPNNESNQEIDQSILNTEMTISKFMETLLSEKILEIIINAAKFDKPTGIALHCFRFLTRLLKDYKLNLLNHSSICNSINELISLCAINIAGPYESSEIDFLSIIVNKIQLNNNLIFSFSRNDFPLLSSLITMLSSPDNNISDKAGQLVIDLISILNEDVTKIILNRTLFKNKIIENLIFYFKQIPSNLKPEDIENVINIQEEDDNPINNLPSLSYSLRKFLIFFKWFSFLDLVLIKCRSPNLLNQLLDEWKKEFLIKNLSLNLFLSNEINLKILSTILTYACLKHCKSTYLKESIIEYLVDEKDLKELNEQFNQINLNEDKIINQDNKGDINQDKNLNDKKKLNRLKILINRCRIKINKNINYQFLFKLNLSNKEENEIYCEYLLSLYTLQLFEEILNKPNKCLFERLFIKNLMKRNYLDISRYNINGNDLNDLEELNKLVDFKLPINDEQQQQQSEECSNSLINNPAIKSIKLFIALIPNELKSSNTDFSFEPYIKESQVKFDKCISICDKWNWPKEIVENYFVESKLNNSNCVDEFCESEFISMLFDNLTNIIQIPYELNLQITSLITKISLFPNPYLHEYLLNPSIPLKENLRSLFSVLHSVIDKLQVDVLGVKQLKIKLNVVRSYLLGEKKDIDGFNITNNDLKILEAIIIIEEFTQEIASLCFVKNSYLI